MNLHSINWLAILVAGISAFVLGGVWYSPALFGNAWMKENKMTPEKVKSGNKGKIFGWSFILSLVMTVNLGMYLNAPGINLLQGAFFGFLSGLWIFCGIAIVALFEQKSARYIFINGGYMLAALILMGAIIGLWK